MDRGWAPGWDKLPADRRAVRKRAKWGNGSLIADGSQSRSECRKNNRTDKFLGNYLRLLGRHGTNITTWQAKSQREDFQGHLSKLLIIGLSVSGVRAFRTFHFISNLLDQWMEAQLRQG